MGKKNGITPFNFWQTKKQNGIEDRYIRLGNSQMCDFAMKSLNPNSFKVYAYMLLESGGSLDFKFPYAKFKTICSKGGFQKAKDELVANGFIVVKENNAHRKLPNVYSFSDKWKEYKE